jgi:hypothetical protein
VDSIAEKLERIKELWRELKRAEEESVERRALTKRIRVLSDEYHPLIAAKMKSNKSK